jgi:glycine/D-amino acid oxidase-like deaminating enzyme
MIPPLSVCLFCYVDVDILGYHTDSCVTMVTPTGHPYIDMVTPRLGVAIGGNGHAAKSCDEIGRLAARMLLGEPWDGDFDRDTFRLRMHSAGTKSPKYKQRIKINSKL